MHVLNRRKPADGVLAWTWLTYYGVTRFVAEVWREPGFTVLGLSGGQLVSLPTILAGAGFRWLNVPFLNYDSTFGDLHTPP